MMDTSEASTNAAKEPDVKPVVRDVGLTLREERERQGLSVHDVAERIKFAPKQIEALEGNDYAHLPQSTFLRGFVRSYARALQLDETALIAALPSAEPAAGQAAAKPPRVEEAFPNIFAVQRFNLMWLGGALVVALALILFVLLHEGEPAPKVAQTVVEPLPLPAPEMATSAVAETTGNVEGAEPVKAEAKTAEPSKASENKMAEPSKKIAEPAKVEEPKKPAEPKKPVVEARKPAEPKPAEPAKAVAPVVKAAPQHTVAASAPAAAGAVKPGPSLEALKRRPLHFVFNADTWAEVTDAQGVVLLSRNNPAGTEKWVGGPRHEPYDITIANPASVKLYYKGKEVDLSHFAAKKVARLKVE